MQVKTLLTKWNNHFIKVWAITLGVVGTTCGFIALFAPENFFVNFGFSGCIIAFLLITLFSFIWTNRRILKTYSIAEKPNKLSTILYNEIERLYKEKKFTEVVLIGFPVSRALWLNGSYKERIKIGILLEEAAAKTESTIQQISALIDDIGWTLAVVGDLVTAEQNISNGIKKAENKKLFYWAAKGERHIAGIESKKSNKEGIISHLNKAVDYAQKINNPEEKMEMEASLHLSKAEYYLECNNLDDALNQAILAKETYKISPYHSDREVKTHSRMGNIFLRLNRIQEAKDEFNLGYKKAMDIRKDEVGRNLIGLAQVYLVKREFSKAKEALIEAKPIFETMGTDTELKLIAQLLRESEVK